jgi:hypothetical protein
MWVVRKGLGRALVSGVVIIRDRKRRVRRVRRVEGKRLGVLLRILGASQWVFSDAGDPGVSPGVPPVSRLLPAPSWSTAGSPHCLASLGQVGGASRTRPRAPGLWRIGCDSVGNLGKWTRDGLVGQFLPGTESTWTGKLSFLEISAKWVLLEGFF